jgi:PAS domain S-box-containing protein
MQPHVNEISSALAVYLQNHDTASLERIKAEGKETSRLMGELKVRLVENGQGDAGARIEQDHQIMREVTVNLLAADHEAVKARQALSEANDALSSVLSHMQGSIRMNQLNSFGRMRALRVAKAAAADPTKSASRFKRAVSVYGDLSRTRRAERWTEQAQTYFDQSVNRANELQQAEGKKQAALDRFFEKKKALSKALGDTPSDLPPARAATTYIVLNGILILVGVLFVWRTYRHVDIDFARPLQDILRCVEAAAAGDTSQVPGHESTDEVGQLSQATGRLIGVLARSENLIYHLAALVEASGDAIISHTLDGKILSWNKGAQRIYGYSAEEMKGRSIEILSPEDDGAQMMRNLRRIRNAERIQPFETLHQARNGRRVPVLVRVAPIYDSTRKIIGASFIAQDLSGLNLLPSKTTQKNQAA